MNAADLQDMLSTLLADESTNYFTEGERLRALNLACIEINTETQFLRDLYEVTVTPTTEHVLLPEDFCAFASGADWIDSKGVVTNLEYRPLRKARLRAADWETQRGLPEAFTIEGPVILLIPRPTVTGTFRLSYVPLPNEISEEDEPPFYGDPRFNGYGNLIVYRAAWDLLMKDRDYEAADRIQRMYQARMVDFKESLRKTPDYLSATWDIGPYGDRA